MRGAPWSGLVVVGIAVTALFGAYLVSGGISGTAGEEPARSREPAPRIVE